MHIATIDEVKQEVQAWQEIKNSKNCKINWQFSTNDNRIKLKRLYPSFDNENNNRCRGGKGRK